MIFQLPKYLVLSGSVVIGKPLDNMVGVKQHFLKELADVDVAAAVVGERAFPAEFDQAAQPQLGQMLGD